MKNFFKKFKSYGFWVSLSSALILLLTSLGNAFGFEIENQIVEDVIMSIAGVLAVFGIVSMNGKKQDENDNSDNESETNENVEQSEAEVNNESEDEKE